MMDIKINGNTNNGIERVRLVRADGMGVYSLVEADLLDAQIMGTAYDGEYYNSVITKVGRKNPLPGITKINFPNVKTLCNNCFYTSSIKEARLPSLETMGGGDFMSCGVEKVILGPKLSDISGQSFRSATKLTTLVLPYAGVVYGGTYSTTTHGLKDSAFDTGTSSYVYVPAAQVEAYKANAYWSNYANQIRAIEDYPDEVV